MTPPDAPPPDAPPPDLDPGFMPAPVMLVNDVETIKAISDPTRMRMLEAMLTRQDPAWSAKEIAAAIGVPQTRLYHHIDLLTGRGLIRAVEQRVVSGIIETRYRVAARSFQLDRRMFSGDPVEGRELLHSTLVAVFDTAREQVEESVETGAADLSADAPEPRRMLLSRGVLRLSPARLAELRRRLVELEGEFDHEDDPDGGAYGVVIALYPMPPLREAGDA